MDFDWNWPLMKIQAAGLRTEHQAARVGVDAVHVGPPSPIFACTEVHQRFSRD